MEWRLVGHRDGMPDNPQVRDEDTIDDRTQEVVPEDTDVLLDPHHDDQTAAEAAEQADPGATAAHPGA